MAANIYSKVLRRACNHHYHRHHYYHHSLKNATSRRTNVTAQYLIAVPATPRCKEGVQATWQRICLGWLPSQMERSPLWRPLLSRLRPSILEAVAGPARIRILGMRFGVVRRGIVFLGARCACLLFRFWIVEI